MFKSLVIQEMDREKDFVRGMVEIILKEIDKDKKKIRE